jgi:4-hydroxybenzoate polyprenyltransferase
VASGTAPFLQPEEHLGSIEAFQRLSVPDMVRLVRSTPEVPVSWRERWIILLMLGRPRTCVVGMLTFVLGMEYAGGGFTLPMVVGAILSTLGGFLANLGNTYTDLQEDCRNLPGRVLQLARFGYRRMFWTLAILNTAMLVTAALINLYCVAFMAVALVLVHEYSFGPLRAKDRPLVGLLVFAQVVSYPFLSAATIEPRADLLHALLPSLGLLPASLSPELAHQAHRLLGMWAFITLWFTAKGMFKNVPDYHGDRAAGLRTSATIFSSWRNAAVAATVATVLAYLSLGGLVALGLERPVLLLALLWLAPVTWNCLRLIRADGGASGNLYLKTDMILSVGFIASVLLLASPRWQSVAAIAVGGLIIFGSDLLRVDSRREADLPSRPA